MFSARKAGAKFFIRRIRWGAGWLITALLVCNCTMPERYLFNTSNELNFSADIEDLEFKEFIFPAVDGTLLYGWYLPGDNTRKIILYFHGTAANISHLTHQLRDLKGLDAGIFVFDYRGFGRSQGEPTEAGTYQDARGALDFLLNSGWTQDRIIYFGHSLGAAVALQLALEKSPAGIVLESPFTSIPDLVRHHHPLVFSALHWAFPPFYDNRTKITGVHSPVMIFHGQNDRIVPPAMAYSLYSLAPNPKFLLIVPEAGHDDVYLVGGKEYLMSWRRFLSQVVGRKKKVSSP